MINKPLKNRLWLPVILLIICLAALIISGRFLVEEKKLAVTRKTDLAKLQLDLQILDKILDNQEVFGEKVNFARKTLPANPEELAFFISQVEKLSQAHNQELEIKINDFADDESGNLSSLTLVFKTAGSYSSLTSFLSELANLPYHTRIDSFKIEKTEQGVVSLINCRLFLPGKEMNENN